MNSMSSINLHPLLYNIHITYTLVPPACSIKRTGSTTYQVNKTGWVNHILGTQDGLGQPHTRYTRRAGSTTYWVHQTGWVNHILGTLDGLVRVNTSSGNPCTLYATFEPTCRECTERITITELAQTERINYHRDLSKIILYFYVECLTYFDI